jgi:outer membrane protein assembly factor BamB
VDVGWSVWGAFINSFDGMSSPDWSWWWGFFIWNHSQNSWDSSSIGANLVELKEGDIIGWSPAWDFMAPAKPIPTPQMKYPWTQFRHDAKNLGVTNDPGPQTNAVYWVYNTGKKEMAASPAVAQERVIINNYAGVLCLNPEGELLWNNEEVVGSFSPAISDEKVFVGGKDGYLYCLNFTTGDMNWKTKIASHPGISGVTSVPTVDKGKVYVGSFNFSGGPGALFCLDEDSGDVLWENSTPSSVYFSSPCVVDDRVFVGTMGLYNSSTLKWKEPFGMFCFDGKSGDLIWEYSVNGSVGSSPTFFEDSIIFTSKDGNMYRLNSENGELIWKKSIGDSVSSPAVWEDTIFVGSGEMNQAGKLYCLDINGNILWEFTPNGAVQSSPAVTVEYVYFTTNVPNGTVYCLKRDNGKLVWQFTPTPKQYMISSPVIVEVKLYVASDNGRLYCFGGRPPNVTVDAEGATELLYAGEDAKFYHKGEEKGFKISAMNSTAVTLKFDFLIESERINLGETAMLDCDGNGKEDLSITMDSINAASQSASLTFKEISETPDETDSNLSLVLAMIFIIIVVIGVIIIVKRR